MATTYLTTADGADVWTVDGTSVWTKYGVSLPDGTQLRMDYHGRTHYAHMHSGRFYVSGKFADPLAGAVRHASGGSSLNGWDYWSARRPEDETWTLLRTLRYRANRKKDNEIESRPGG